MSLLGKVRSLVMDPPPAYAFEVSGSGIAWSVLGQTGWEPVPDGALDVSPLHDNVRDASALAGTIRKVAPAPAKSRKRRPCALILPDYCARLTVLDFDTLPAKVDEQASLIRFRIKRSLPFDIDSAALSFKVQNTAAGRQDVLVAAVSLEILSRYEAPFRAAGLHPGIVTVSSLAMMDLVEPSEKTTLIVRLAAGVITLLVTSGGTMKLIRCLHLTDSSQEEIEAVILPTLAFIEDEFRQPVARVLHCGLDQIPNFWPPELDVAAIAVAPSSAGLMGYLRALSN